MKLSAIAGAALIVLSVGLMASCGTSSGTKSAPETPAAPAAEAPASETTNENAASQPAVNTGDSDSEKANGPAEAVEAPASADDAQEVPGDLVRCEAKIDYEGEVFSGEALGPTLEEARDNAIDETCALPCSDKLSDDAQESDRETQLDDCIEHCSAESVAVAAQCWQHGESIYTEGAWSATNDAAPTNGAEH